MPWKKDGQEEREGGREGGRLYWAREVAERSTVMIMKDNLMSLYLVLRGVRLVSA